VELAPVVAAAVAAAREGLAAAEVQVELAVDVPVALTLAADRAALTDVLIVLVQNALIACGERPGAGVRVQARLVRDTIEIRVEDDGPGVPAEIEDRLLEPFVSGRGRDHRHPGTGLGLAVAARWAVRHGGSLRHERPPAGGARFVVALPRGGPDGAA
jgi:signal transduction histidine kinase